MKGLSLCGLDAVAEEDCDSRSALVAVQTTDKKKGLWRGLLGKLTKKDSKPASSKQAPPPPPPPITVKRKPAPTSPSAAVIASQNTERHDAADVRREPV